MAQTAELIGFDAVGIEDHVGFGDPAGRLEGGLEIVDAAVGTGGLDPSA